jgi:hypothetical protein
MNFIFPIKRSWGAPIPALPIWLDPVQVQDISTFALGDPNINKEMQCRKQFTSGGKHTTKESKMFPKLDAQVRNREKIMLKSEWGFCTQYPVITFTIKLNLLTFGMQLF